MLGIHTYRSDMFAPGLIFERNVNDTKIFDRLFLGDCNTIEYQTKSWGWHCLENNMNLVLVALSLRPDWVTHIEVESMSNWSQVIIRWFTKWGVTLERARRMRVCGMDSNAFEKSKTRQKCSFWNEGTWPVRRNDVRAEGKGIRRSCHDHAKD